MRIKSIVFAVSLLVFPAILVGCGGQQDADVEMADIGCGGMDSIPASCCPDPSNRPECILAGTHTATAISINGVNAINAASAGNAAAIQLAGSRDAVDGTHTSAATEATNTLPTDSTGIARGALTAGAETPRLGGSGSTRTSGAGGSSSGGVGNGSSVATSAVEPPKKVDEASLGRAGRDSAYAGGGARPESGSDPFRGLASLGQGGDGANGAGGSSQVTIGPDGKPMVAPMGSLDPEDYFKRGGNINLFRRVNAAHERKTQSWALNQARDAVTRQ